MRRVAIGLCLLILGACAGPAPECPREGGIVGTGGCEQQAPLN